VSIRAVIVDGLLRRGSAAPWRESRLCRSDWRRRFLYASKEFAKERATGSPDDPHGSCLMLINVLQEDRQQMSISSKFSTGSSPR